MDQAAKYEGAWRQTVETVYDVFSAYGRPGSLESSPMKDADKILRDLTSAPLRNLPASKLTDFEGAALYTVGTPLDYKHFLPRLLELMSDDAADASIYAEIVARKLNYARFSGWAKEEVFSIQALFRASLHAAFFKPPYNSNIENLVVGNVDAGNGLEEILSEVSVFAGPNAVRNVAGLVVETITRIDERSWLGLQLKASDKAVLHAWCRSKSVAETLYSGVDLVLDDDAWEIETALASLG